MKTKTQQDASWLSWAILALLLISWVAAITFFFMLDWQRAVGCLMISLTLLVVGRLVN